MEYFSVLLNRDEGSGNQTDEIIQSNQYMMEISSTREVKIEIGSETPSEDNIVWELII